MNKTYHHSDSHGNAANFRRRMARYKKQMQGEVPKTGEKIVVELPILLPAVRRIK